MAFKRDGSPSGPGPLVELLVVGGATPILFAVSWLLRRRFGLDASEYAVGFSFFYLAYVVNDPHFAVTYVLFYRDFRGRALGRAFGLGQRVRYLVAGVVAPVALAAWAVSAIATRSAASLGLMIQLMFLLVGWHYVKQGFGVFVVLCARRGVVFDARERLAVLAHCFAGWAYAWASPADRGSEVEEKGVVYTTLAHGLGLERVTYALFLSTALPLAWVLARKWRREGRLPVVTPLVALLLTVWSWTIYSSLDPLVRYAIPALHSVQYLYFVWLLRGNEATAREGPPFFGPSRATRLGILAASALGLGFVLFHGAPAVLDGALVPGRAARAGPLGPTPGFAALFTFVNIHHYLMDHVVWRRENPETRYLRGPGLAEAAILRAMNDKLRLESFLALAAIGWADGSLQRIEREGLVRAAKECGIAGDDLARVEQASKEHRTLDGVDLGGLSRWEQVLTYALASWFAALDGVVSTSEHETLIKVGDKLKLDPSLRVRATAAANDIACLPGGGRPDRYDFVKLVARLRERLPQLAKET